MPDSRSHRGAHPRDALDFSPQQVGRLRLAAAELSWLLTRGYPMRRSTVLVGDRHALRERQRKAVGRCAASESALAERQQRQIHDIDTLRGQELWVDGYNVLLTVEAALGGGVLLRGADGALRDMAAMSSHYKRVEETVRALELIGDYLEPSELSHIRWLLDRPISNSGRLKALMLETADRRRWPWSVDLVANPDKLLKECESPVASADSAILESCGGWLNLASRVVAGSVADPWIVELTATDPSQLA